MMINASKLHNGNGFKNNPGREGRSYIRSRHAILCRAAQEAGTPHLGYIGRKKENVIFTPLYLGDPLSDCNQICYRVTRQLEEAIFQI